MQPPADLGVLAFDPARPATPRALRLVVAIIVAVSVVWAVIHRPSLSAIHRHPGRLGPFVAVLVGANLVYAVALVVTASAVARHAVGDGRLGLAERVRRYGSVRRWGDDVLVRVSSDRWFQAGFTVNWTAAVIASLVPPTAVVTFLPRSAWGLLSISVLDLGGTMVVRLAIRSRIRRLRGPLPA